jgi:TP901 family phage tail tape measure protein
MATLIVTGKADFTQLKQEIAQLQATPITLRVDAKGFDEISSKAIRAMNAQARLTRAQNELAVAQEKTQQSAYNLAAAQEKTKRQTQALGNEAEKTAKKTSTLWNSFKNNVASTAIRKIKNAFRDAFAAMKDVDDELVTVRKVTGFTAEELEALEKQAYKTASAYGVAADEYLGSVAAFARAGYKEQSEALAELATKTQLVGDTTAETAQQFLLSVDAAYKYKGNIDALTKVLDGANEIDNNYATSIEKIAEGLGKVAPIASQAHVGIDELTAAIGTVTAVTQRSGTEAATALRALFLNIIGDTKTEIDEGVTWTTGEIAGLRDVIKIYAKDAYEAAQATGKVIDPMEAIGGLAKSMQDGLLTESELMAMVSDIGGKLRTSQLLAIVENWDMYQSMLDDYAAAAGSADREVENMMDSWSRKVEVLKNTWTEFISNTIDTDWIKGILDALTWLIEGFDNLGNAIFTVTGLLVAFNTQKIAGGIDNILFSFKNLGVELGLVKRGAHEAASGIGKTATAASAAGAAIGVLTAAITIAVFAYNKYQQKLEEATEEAAEAAEKANGTAESILTLNGKFETAKEGSDAYKDALKELSGVLGEDMPESADAAIAKLQELTDEQLKAASTTAYAAKAAAGRQLEGNFFTQLGSYGGLILSAPSTGNKDLDATLGTAILAGGGTFTKNQVHPEGAMLPSSYDAEGLIEYYDTLVKVRDLMQQTAYDTENSALLQTDFYHDVVDALSVLEKHGASAYKTAEQQELKAKALAQVQSDLRLRTIDTAEAYDEYIQSIKDSGEYSEEYKKLLIEVAQDALPEFAEAAQDAAAGLEDADEAARDLFKTLDTLAGKLKGVTAAFDEFDENGTLSYSTLSELHEAFGDLTDIDDYISKLADANLTGDGLRSIMGEMTEKLIAQKVAAGELTAADENLVAKMLDEAGVANAAKVAHALLAQAAKNTADQEQKAADAAENAAAAAGDAKGAVENLSRTNVNTSGIVNAVDNITTAMDTAYEATDRLQKKLLGETTLTKKFTTSAKNLGSQASRNGKVDRNSVGSMLENAKSTLSKAGIKMPTISWKGSSTSGSSGGSGGGGGGGYSSEEDETLAALEYAIKLLNSELDLMDEQGKSEDELNAKRKEIQEALMAEIKYLEAIGGDQIDINDLYTEWWRIQNDIVGKQADSLKLEEMKAEVLKRQNDLLEAQRERTIRVYNAQTGQWEWIADEKAVKDAQEAYDEAMKDFTDAGGSLSAESLLSAPLEGADGMGPVSAGLLTAAGVARTGATYSSTSTTTNNNGDVYTFGGVSLTQEQAARLTVAELARLARGLGVQNEA